MMKFKRLLTHCRVYLLVALFASLSGCANIPLTSMYALSKLDPFAINPHQLVIVVRTHEALRLSKGDIKMNIGYRADDDSIIIDDLYLVEIDHNHLPTKRLLDDIEEYESLTFLSLNSADAQQLQTTLQTISTHKHGEQKGQGSFGVGVTASCAIIDMPENELLVDIFIKSSNDAKHIQMIKNLNIYQQQEMSAFKSLPSCEQ